jgi:hypothetical protein
MLKNKDCGWRVSIPEDVGVGEKWSGHTTIAVYKHSWMNLYMYCYLCWNFWTWETNFTDYLSIGTSGVSASVLKEFYCNIILKSRREWNSPVWKMVKLIQAMCFYGEKCEISFLLSPWHWQLLLCECHYIVGNVGCYLFLSVHIPDYLRQNTVLQSLLICYATNIN